MAMAFADQAFLNNFAGAEGIHALVVLASRACLCLYWHEELR
jgi:hypothetical protein